jgi:hypothetical protein
MMTAKDETEGKLLHLIVIYTAGAVKGGLTIERV